MQWQKLVYPNVPLDKQIIWVIVLEYSKEFLHLTQAHTINGQSYFEILGSQRMLNENLILFWQPINSPAMPTSTELEDVKNMLK